MKIRCGGLLALALALLCALSACGARPKLSEMEQGELFAYLEERGVVLQPGAGPMLRDMLAELEEDVSGDGPFFSGWAYPYYLYEELRAAVVDYYGLEPPEIEPVGAVMAQQIKEAFEDLIEERTALVSHLGLELPAGVTAGKYDLYYRDGDYGNDGGYPLLDKKGEECGGVVLYTHPVARFDSEGILRWVSPLRKDASLSGFTHVDSGAPCTAAVFSGEVFDRETGERLGTHEQWCALWCEPDSRPIYALFIDRDKMDYGAFLEIVTSAAFEDGAFEKQ